MPFSSDFQLGMQHINYPDANPNVVYVYFLTNPNRLFTKCSRINLFDELEYLDTTIENLYSELNMVFRSFDIWPEYNSEEYFILKRLLEGEDMPVESSAQPANEYSFVITYNYGLNMFHMEAPRNQNTFHEQDFNDINEAYNSSQRYAASLRRGNSANPYHTWPRRNSNHYQELLGAKASSNPTKVKGYVGFKDIMQRITNNPTDKINEVYITYLIDYLCWVRYSYNNNSNQTREIKEYIKHLLKEATGVDWLPAEDCSSFIHPDNAQYIYVDDTVSTYVYSSAFIKSECKTCTSCDKVYIKNYIVTPVGGGSHHYCPSCISESGWYRCSLCSNTWHHEDNGCPEFNKMPVSHIYNYSQDIRAVLPKMLHLTDDVPINGSYMRYGIELEVLVRDTIPFVQATESVGHAIKGHAIMKQDSSLHGGNGGFEIVTVPATLDYHRKVLWEKLFTKNSSGAIPSQQVWAWHTKCCGIHVHVTRAALDKMQLAKLCVFYNEGVNSAFLSKIAGREVGPNAHYCKSAKKKLRANIRTGETTADDCKDHHEAITISQRNRGKTVEIRIFRGNCTRHGVMRALEFVDATVLWCKNNSAQDLNHHKFLAWFDHPTIRSKYPDLWRHLLDMGYLITPHKSKEVEGIAENNKKRIRYTGEKKQKLQPLNELIA